MWKLFNKYFGWDYVLLEFGGSWCIRKVQWLAGEPFVNTLPPCGDRTMLLPDGTADNYGRNWKPLTYIMKKYKLQIKNTIQ